MTEQETTIPKSKITVDEIVTMIKKEAAFKRQVMPLKFESSSPLSHSHFVSKGSMSRIVVNTVDIQRLVTVAESNSDAGSEVSPMEQFSGLFRFAARTVGKVVVVLLKFITDKQRAFNITVVSALRALTDSHERLSRNCAVEFERLQSSFDSRINALEKKYDAQFQEFARIESEIRLTILEQRRSLGVILEQVAGLSPPNSRADAIKEISQETDHLYDDLYFVFENHFRGSREDVKDRLKVYQPYVDGLQPGSDSTFVDLGCGRGEWLELLKDNGFNCKGIDFNWRMIDCCQSLGLDVMNEDALSYLRSLHSCSVNAVSGFHILEHLSFDKLIAMFDESLRVLRPGGMIIFETPNPENVVVGSCNFYFDATHRNPLPPATVSFIAEQRGFTDVEILRLHPVKQPEYTGHEFVDELLHRFNNEQDYSVIAYKPK